MAGRERNPPFYGGVKILHICYDLQLRHRNRTKQQLLRCRKPYQRSPRANTVKRAPPLFEPTTQSRENTQLSASLSNIAFDQKSLNLRSARTYKLQYIFHFAHFFIEPICAFSKRRFEKLKTLVHTFHHDNHMIIV